MNVLAFPAKNSFYEKFEGVDYYGIKQIKHTFWRYRQKEIAFCEEIKRVIDEVNPNVILCFGTENGLGLACTLTDIPVIIHLQGILNPYYETWMPQGLSWGRWLWGNKDAILTWLALKEFRNREMKIFKSCRYFFGRTDWDQSITRLLAPQAKYFYCSEMLRPEIYNSKKVWKPRQNEVKRIVSIISGSIYKGGDVVLRAAKVLKENVRFDFVWEVYGVGDMKQWEKLTHIRPDEVNVVVTGIIDAGRLIDIVTTADVYVHPSYIENSPNTVCEAQLLGIPVIATNVGGVSSLVEHGKTGLLVPPNDPYLMAATIEEIFFDINLANEISANGRKKSLERHNSTKIVEELMSAIEIIIA